MDCLGRERERPERLSLACGCYIGTRRNLFYNVMVIAWIVRCNRVLNWYLCVMQSKFWGKNSDSEETEDEYSSSEEETSTESSEYSSSDASSGSSSDSDSDDSGKGASRFLMGSSDSESEEERRVVKSAKAKAAEELNNICDEIRDNMNDNEWAAIQTLWDKLHKQVDKIKKATGMLGTPRPYIKIIVELEDFLNTTLEGMLLLLLLLLPCLG